MHPGRRLQNISAFLTILLGLAVVAAPAVAQGIVGAQFGLASGGKTQDNLVVTSSQLAAATYTFTNETGVSETVDVLPQLVASGDVPTANGQGWAGLTTAGIALINSTHGGPNASVFGASGELDLTLRNGTIQNCLGAPCIGLAYTFRAVASGQTEKVNNGVLDQYNYTNWHQPGDPDFGFTVGVVQGTTVLAQQTGMTINTGSSVAGNYSKPVTFGLKELASADLDGLRATNGGDNPIQVRITGYHAGSFGGAGDIVTFSLKLTQPAGSGAKSYTDIWGYTTLIYGVLLLVAAGASSHLVVLRRLHLVDRPFGGRPA
jgi:hypothetical protein